MARSDWLIPLHLSDLLWAIGSRSNDAERWRGFSPASSSGNGGAEQLRWPEMLVDDAGEAGTRGKHEEAWLDAVVTMEVVALEGEVPINGAVQLLPAAAPACSDVRGAVVSLQGRIVQVHS